MTLLFPSYNGAVKESAIKRPVHTLSDAVSIHSAVHFFIQSLAPFKRDFRKYAVGARLVQLQLTYDAAGLDALLHSQNNQ